MKRSNLSDPVLFAQNELHHQTWKTQEAILRAVARHRKVSAKACHASSKTFLASEIALFWLAKYNDGRVLITAPAFRQTQTQIFLEIHRAVAGSSFPFPQSKLLQTSFTLSPTNYILALTATGSASFQGYHGENLLIIMDEATGIDAAIFEGAAGILAGGNNAHLLLLGNPTVASGPFYDSFTRERAAFKNFTISAFDTPNLEGVSIEQLLAMSEAELDDNPMPFLCTRRWVKEKYLAWWNGSEDNSPLWTSRVLGQFPSQSENALISLSWLEGADRKREGEVEAVFAGIDVAGPGSDETVATIVSGGAILESAAWTAPDPRGPVAAFLGKWKSRLRLARVDSAGIGYNFALHLRDLGFPIEMVNVGESAREPERFINRKAELYWTLREAFREGRISGLTDPETVQQLASVRYQLDGAGRVQIESKEAARKRGVHSPDRAEALLLALPPAAWNAEGIRLIPSEAFGRFDATDARKLATGRGPGGFKLSEVEKQDLLDDLQVKVRSSQYLRRTNRGIFHRAF